MDVIVTKYPSGCNLRMETNEAHQWLKYNAKTYAENAQWIGDALSVRHDEIESLIAALTAENFTVNMQAPA